MLNREEIQKIYIYADCNENYVLQNCKKCKHVKNCKEVVKKSIGVKYLCEQLEEAYDLIIEQKEKINSICRKCGYDMIKHNDCYKCESCAHIKWFKECAEIGDD